ncbi:MAG: hypothetical protein ACLR9K_12380 [Blautia sp.]
MKKRVSVFSVCGRGLVRSPRGGESSCQTGFFILWKENGKAENFCRITFRKPFYEELKIIRGLFLYDQKEFVYGVQMKKKNLSVLANFSVDKRRYDSW